jgi:predicted ATP-binding protein involved in virulence
MKITELHLKGFRGIEEMDIKFPESNLAVFIGDNGAGKSSVLDAVALALGTYVRGLGISNKISHAEDLFIDGLNINTNYCKLEASFILDPFYGEQTSFQLSKEASIEEFETHWKGENFYQIIRNYRDMYETFLDEEMYFPVIAHYKVDRNFLKDTEEEKSKELERVRLKVPQLRAYLQAFGNFEGFEAFVHWFVEEQNEENRKKVETRDLELTIPSINTVRNALNNFFSYQKTENYSNLTVGKTKFEKLTNSKATIIINKNGNTLPLRNLSDGEKISILLVADIAHRLAIANPGLENPLQGQGIVLIDEIELHLHPRWQREIIPALTKTFPNIQFIITTHSPQVLSTVPAESVFVIEDFKLQEGEFYTEGRDSNAILSELQGVGERPEEYDQKLGRFYRLVDMQKLEEAEQILEELAELFGENDTAIIRARTFLDLAKDEAE